MRRRTHLRTRSWRARRDGTLTERSHPNVVVRRHEVPPANPASSVHRTCQDHFRGDGPQRDADRPRGPVRVTAALSYSEVGATCVADPTWPSRPPGYRSYEQTIRIGHGEQHWEAATAAVQEWAVKTRSGFTVQPAEGGEGARVRQGQNYTLVASLGPFRLREPVQVVSVIERPDRCGFAYGTRAGHPVTGEEAFIVHRHSDGSVWLTLRSLTRPGIGQLAVRLSRRIGGPALVSPSLHACAGARLTGRGRFSHQWQTGNDMGRLRDRCPHPRLRPGP